MSARQAIDLAPLKFAYNSVVTNDDKMRVLIGAFPLLVGEIERLRSALSEISEEERDAAARGVWGVRERNQMSAEPYKSRVCSCRHLESDHLSHGDCRALVPAQRAGVVEFTICSCSYFMERAVTNTSDGREKVNVNVDRADGTTDTYLVRRESGDDHPNGLRDAITRGKARWRYEGPGSPTETDLIEWEVRAWLSHQETFDAEQFPLLAADIQARTGDDRG